jgi:signal transduction histidine kinase
MLFRRVRDLNLKSVKNDLLEIIYFWDDIDNNIPLIKDEIARLNPQEISGKTNERLKKILEFMKKKKIAAIFPLNRKVQLNGLLLLGPKYDESAYTVQDVDFIESIVANASVAIGRSLLYEQVQDFATNLEKKVKVATEELSVRAKELDRKNKALEDAAQRERDMMDIVGHELRTPATVVKNALAFIEMMKRKKRLSNKKLKDYINKAQSAIEREIKLINTFLGAAKFEGGQLQFEPTIFSLVELVKQVYKENDKHAQTKDLNLILKQTKKSIPQIEADRNRIAEVIDNLISNAIKYTSEGKIWVWIDTDKKEDTVSVYVKDTGIGIPKKDQDRLFSKFGRVKNHVSEEERMARIVRPGGTGLGLYVSRGIIKLHGGNIFFKSKKDRGSIFWFTIPVKHKIPKKHLINPIFSKDGEKEIFKKLGMKGSTK